MLLSDASKHNCNDHAAAANSYAPEKETLGSVADHHIHVIITVKPLITDTLNCSSAHLEPPRSRHLSTPYNGQRACPPKGTRLDLASTKH